jgi:hypothetical protein
MCGFSLRSEVGSPVHDGLNHLESVEFAHIHRDETTLIHHRLLGDTLCQRAPEAENRTSLISQNQTFLKSPNK